MYKMVESRMSGELSLAQRRLWVLEQMAGGKKGRQHTHMLRIRGPLNISAMQHAVEDIAIRHETLRTVFASSGGIPIAQLAFDLGVVKFTDLRGHPDPELAAWRHEQARCREPLALSPSPPWRAEVLQLAHDCQALLIVAHPIIADAHSVQRVAAELAESYLARARGAPSPPVSPAAQYADYVRWQDRWLQEGELTRLLDYWQRLMTGAPVRMALDGRAADGSVEPGASELLAFALPAGCAQVIRALAGRPGATLHAVVLGSLLGLFHRYTGSTDLVVGIPHSGRFDPGHGSIVGPLASLLPLRVPVAPTDRFDAVVTRVAERVASARAHAGLPFARLLDALRTERASARTALVQIAFALDDDTGPLIAGLDGLTAEPQVIAHRHAEVDLDVSVVLAGDTVAVGFEYRTARYERAFITQLARSWQAMLAGLDAGCEIGAAPVLAAEDRARLEAWNDSACDLGDATAVELIDDQIRRAPHHPALLGAGGSLTYGQLGDRASRLARCLVAEGIGPESIVAVMIERSVELVVALLAVLRAGAAYLPVDPAGPHDRIAFMLADAGAALAICRSRCTRTAGVRAIALDEHPDTALDDPVALPPPALDRLAYVIYTSGSTGQPKGVMVEHGSLANQLRWLRQCFPLSAADRVACKYGIAFDASLWEILGTLACGAQLVIVESGRERDLDHQLELFARLEVTVLDTVPSVLDALLRHHGFGRLTALRRVTCGGELLPAATAALLAARTAAELHNMYGPTEATITATSYRVAHAASGPGVPIGRPAANTTVHVLDDALRPVPPGVVGELCIGGVQVARGYLHRPELTAAAFVADPFRPPGAGRLFRTGDLGRLRADGNLEFVGRRDLQVKVRGHRIELEEVEAAVAALPVVRDCAVALETGHGDGASLSAYLVAAPGCEPSVKQLRAALREAIPDYMIPARFFGVPSLPRTADGKLDRAAITGTAARRLAEQSDSPAQGRTELALAALWQELLGCEQPGAQTDFFEAGGDSLLAVELVRRIAGELGCTAEVRDVFEAPTIAQLAIRIEDTVAERRTVALPPVTAAPVPDGPLALSVLQQQRLPDGPLTVSWPADHLHIAVWLHAPLDLEAMHWAMGALSARHAMLRTRFMDHGGRRAQVTECDVDLPVRVVELDAGAPADRERALRELVAAEIDRGFDLARAPLARAMLVRGDGAATVLVLVGHRAVVDRPSLDIALRDFSRFYFHRIDGCPPPAALAVSYADFVRWQRAVSGSPALAAQLEYWGRQLTGAPRCPLGLLAAPGTPADRPIRVAFEIPHGVAEALRAVARRHGVGLFVPLLAGFHVAVGRLGGVTDVVIGTPITGRRGLPAIEPLVGVFDGLLPLRADLSGDPGLDDLIRQLRDTIHGARTNQDALLVEPGLGEPVGLGAAVFCHQVDPPRRTGTVALQPLQIDASSVAHDLELCVIERAGSLTGVLRARSGLLEVSRLDRLAGDYAALLEAAAADSHV